MRPSRLDSARFDRLAREGVRFHALKEVLGHGAAQLGSGVVKLPTCVVRLLGMPEDDVPPGQTRPFPFASQRRQSRSMSEARTRWGTPLDVTRSAFQKAVRRNQPEEAFFWGHELLVFGLNRYFWKVCFQIAVEDVGDGDPDCVRRIAALERAASVISDNFKSDRHGGLAEAQAVLILCEARKSWRGLHLLLHTKRECRRMEQGEIPPREPRPESYDAHCQEGRRRGARKVDFWREGHALAPRGRTHFLNGPEADEFQGVHGDPTILDE